MPIKQSDLVQKWYYGGAQIFFWSFQGLVALVMIFDHKGIIDIILGFAVYSLILIVAWKIILYIAFDGVEKDNQTHRESDTNPIQKKQTQRHLKVSIVALFTIVIISISLNLYFYLKLEKMSVEEKLPTYYECLKLESDFSRVACINKYHSAKTMTREQFNEKKNISTETVDGSLKAEAQ